jgi:hypothetical protein
VYPATYELHTELQLRLIEGFAAMGRYTEAISLADDSIGRTEANGDYCFLPELLRLRGKALSFAPERRIDEAQD